MRYDDDALERALSGLALEEPPAGLHAAVMAMTVSRPAPVVRQWELWIIGAALAVAAWLVLAISGNALTGGASTSHAIGALFDYAGAAAVQALNWETLLWLAIGSSAALWIATMNNSGETGTEA